MGKSDSIDLLLSTEIGKGLYRELQNSYEKIYLQAIKMVKEKGEQRAFGDYVMEHVPREKLREFILYHSISEHEIPRTIDGLLQMAFNLHVNCFSEEAVNEIILYTEEKRRKKIIEESKSIVKKRGHKEITLEIVREAASKLI